MAATTSRRQTRRATRADEKGQIREVSDLEGWKILDKRAHRYLGIDAEEFIRRWDAGVYRDNADRRDVLRVAAALPFARAKTRSRR